MKPKMIAHRGYSQFEKENTLVAFSAAGAITEFYGIETDVHLTSDGKYITIHDDTTDRVTNDRVKLFVTQNSYDIISKVILSDVDNTCNRNDLTIPLMSDYFKICKKYNKIAVCELKMYYTKQQLLDIIEIIKSLDMLENTVFISFFLENLILLREISNELSAQWLLCKFEDQHIETLLKYKLDVDVHHLNISKEQIDLCHQNNIKVNLWTVNDQELANKYASWGVDFITSNWVKDTY